MDSMEFSVIYTLLSGESSHAAGSVVSSDGDGTTDVATKTERLQHESSPGKSETEVSGDSGFQCDSPEPPDELQEKLARLTEIVISDASTHVDPSIRDRLKQFSEEVLESQYECDRVLEKLKMDCLMQEDSIIENAGDIRDMNTEYHYRSGLLSVHGVVKLVEERVRAVSLGGCSDLGALWSEGIQNVPVISELVSKIFKEEVNINTVVSSILSKTAELAMDKQALCLRSVRGPKYAVILDSDLLNLDEISLLVIFSECLDLNSSCGTYDAENEFQICHEIQEEFWNSENIHWPFLWKDLPAMEEKDVLPRTVCWDVEKSLDDLEAFLGKDSPANDLLKETRQELKKKLDQHHIDSAIKMHHISVVKNFLPELVKRKCQINSKLFALDGRLNIPDVLHSDLKSYFPRVPKDLGEKAVFRLWKEAVRDRRYLQERYLGFDAGIDALPLTVQKLLKQAATVDWSAGKEDWRDLEKEKYALVVYPQITANDPQAVRVLKHVCQNLDLICEIV